MSGHDRAELITAWNTRNGVPPASVPQDATEVRVWECQFGCCQVRRAADGLGEQRKKYAEGEWSRWMPALEGERIFPEKWERWHELHGPALAAALSPSVKESPDVG